MSTGMDYKSTCTDWANFLRDIIKVWYIKYSANIEFDGIVEIDESLFGSRIKYHRGDPKVGLRVWV